MNIQRKWVTPITTGAFLLVAATGVLMFFHLDSGANKLVHEWLSWLLLGAAALHVVANFAGFKLHLAARRGQLLIGLFVLLLAASFLPVGGSEKEPPFAVPVRALAEAPLPVLAQVAGISPAQLQQRLAQAGLPAGTQEQSLSDLAGSNLRAQTQALQTVLASDAK